MNTKEINLNSESDTINFAAAVSREIVPEQIILLKGPLGAGKTTFTKGFLKGLGSKDRVKSPTYTIAREYDSPKGKILHLDLYRLTGYDDVVALGWPEITKDYFAILVEWPERLNGILPENAMEISIRVIDNNSRIALTKIK